MSHSIATAPGKAVLSGEYAVLIGAPAVVMALDRRAVVKVSASANNHHNVSTPGFASGSWSFSLGEGGKVMWQGKNPVAGLPLVEAAFATAEIADLPASDFCIDTRAFADATSNRKFGLGSSAAAITALTTILCKLGEPDLDPAAIAFNAHSDFQNGLGSGVDVAASLSGGVVEYHRNNAANVIPRSWPDSLHYAILWSGQPASTHERVAKFDQSNLHSRSVDDLVVAAISFASVWAKQNAAGIHMMLDEYAECLYEFDAANGLGIFAAGHEKLYTQSKGSNVRYKPCGAGGGDTGIAVSDSLDDLAAFSQSAQRLAGENPPQPLALEVAEHGIQISR